jgi:hypothetical protein
MELATTLKSETIQNNIREVGINPNYWYPVAWASQLLFLLKFLAQDIKMVESEQQSYLANPDRRYVEINPVIIAAQRLIVWQYKEFIQSSQPQSSTNKDLETFNETFNLDLVDEHQLSD